MKKIIGLFDYSFYRITKAYLKWDGPEGSTSVYLISLSQSMIILDILLVFFLESFPKVQRMRLKPLVTLVVIGVMVVIALINFRHYKTKYQIFDERWRNESNKQRLLRGVVVVLLILLPLIFPVILLNLKDYTG